MDRLQPVGFGSSNVMLAATKTHRLKPVLLELSSNFDQGGAQAEFSGADGALQGVHNGGVELRVGQL